MLLLSILMIVIGGALLGTLIFEQLSPAHNVPSSSWKETKQRLQLRATARIHRKLQTETVELKDSCANRDRSGLSGYTQDEIEKTAKIFKKVPILFVFDGEKFQVFILQHESPFKMFAHVRSRCTFTIPLLVHALKEIDPDRFQPGKPPFQVLFLDSDLAATRCMDDPKICSNFDKFAPVLAFGSVPKYQLVPSIQVFPNEFFMECIFEWRIKGHRGSCDWPEINSMPKNDQEFHRLINQIIWRGRAHSFLFAMPEFARANNFLFHKFWMKSKNTYKSLIEVKQPENWSQLIPRMRAVIMTLENEFLLQQIEQQYPCKSLEDESLLLQISKQYPGLSLSKPWIDVKFLEASNSTMLKAFKEHGLNVTGSPMYSDAQRDYKYLIDFGGGGGTTWSGTISKLNMPGLLMHHETGSKDWFYDDHLKPMVNCLPIHWDLSNLKEQYDWAENHPQEAKEIAEEGTKLGNYLLSEEYIFKVYNDLFLGYLRQVLVSYDMSNPHALNWNAMKARYEQDGFEVKRNAMCDDIDCFFDGSDGPRATHIASP